MFIFTCHFMTMEPIYESRAPSVAAHGEAQRTFSYLRNGAPGTDRESSIYYSVCGARENAICAPLWTWRTASSIQY